MKGRRYKYIYIFIYIIHQIYFKNAILKRDNKSVIVREKEVHGKYLYSHERGLVDRIISHRGKEGSVVSQRVSHWDLSLKKERKERKTIDFHFFPLPSSFIFVQVHFPVHSPKDSSRISHVSRIRLPRNALNRFFVFCSRFHESRESRYWSTTMIFFIHTKKEKRKKSSWIFFWIDAYLLIDRTYVKYWLLDSRIIISDAWQFRSNFLFYPNVIVRSRWHEQRLVS